MKITVKKKYIWRWFLLFVCFFELCTQIRAFLPSSAGILVLVLGCMAISVLTSRFFNTKTFLYLAFYFMFLLLNLLAGDRYFSNIGKVVEEVAILFFPAVLIYYVFARDLLNFSKYLVIIVFSLIVYFCITTFLVNMEFPGAVRDAVAFANENDPFLVLLYMRGMVNYQLPHAIPILIPAIILNLKRSEYSKFVKILLFVVLAAALVIVYISYSATALLLSTLTIVLSLVVKKDALESNLIRIGVITLIAAPFIISPDFILRPIIQLFSSSENTVYFDRLMEIQNLSSTGSSSGDIASRQNMYGITLSLLSDNLLLGTNRVPGGHMAIIDRLASLGLIGWIPYICFIVSQIRKSAKKIDSYSLIYYYIGVSAGLFMLTFKGMSNFEVWFMLFTVLPILIWLPNRIRIEKYKKI